MPNTVIYANVLPSIGLLLVMFFMRINPLFNKNQNRLFFLSALITLFMLIVISVDYTVSLSPFHNAWIIRRVASFLNFSFSCATPIFLIHIFTNKKMSHFLYLPAFINMLICAASMFVKLIFYHSNAGGYERGPLFFIPALTTIFYLVFLLIISLMRRHERSHEALFLVIAIIGFVFSIYLEVVNRFKFLSWDFAAVFLILYYLLLNINKSKIDPLTGANNRAMYIQKTESINGSRRCIIAMIDINGFKAINDEKGHEEGDKVLIQFVSTVKLFMDKNTVLYRVGGDEFAVISTQESIEEFKKRMDLCFEKLIEQNIYCAVGIAVHEYDRNIKDTIQTADLEMYDDKRRYYSDKAQL